MSDEFKPNDDDIIEIEIQSIGVDPDNWHTIDDGVPVKITVSNDSGIVWSNYKRRKWWKVGVDE